LDFIGASAGLGPGAVESPAGLAVSPDGSRLHVTTSPLMTFGNFPPSNREPVLDPLSLAEVPSRSLEVSGSPVELARTSELLTIGRALGFVIAPPYYLARTPVNGQTP